MLTALDPLSAWLALWPVMEHATEPVLRMLEAVAWVLVGLGAWPW